MIEIKGKFNTALCYTPELEERAAEQIRAVCDEKAFKDSKIRIMPDVHAGKGCTIGTTMTISDKIVPGMVGVDIGCGMETVKITQRHIDFEKLDALIHRNIPCGREVRSEPHEYNAQIALTELRCGPCVNLDRAAKSIGTLGGGNHFIEADRSDAGDIYIVVHSGSRHLGLEVADYYQEQGRQAMWGGARYQIEQLIVSLKAEGRFQEIQPAVTALKKEHKINMPRDLTYVEGKLFEDYIHDMRIVQHFAVLNRKVMMDAILSDMGFTKSDEFTTIHNYIDTDAMILRKGSVSAEAGEKLLIPINMRDGSLICIGKGNPEWNYFHERSTDMEKFIFAEKLSKKKQREQNAARRGSWYGLNPVTRKPENSKAYNRRKARKWSDDSMTVPFVILSGRVSSEFHPVVRFERLS